MQTSKNCKYCAQLSTQSSKIANHLVQFLPFFSVTWLKTEGSPKSQVTKVDYVIMEPHLTLTEFTIDRSKNGRRFDSVQ